jgi:hypothetical protein
VSKVASDRGQAATDSVRTKLRKSTVASSGRRAPRSSITPDRPNAYEANLEKLARIGVSSLLDLVLHLPLRYDDETRLYPINEAPAGQSNAR